MSAFIVVNMRSAGGRTKHEWPAIEQALRAIYPSVTFAFTRGRNDATKLVREALREDYQEIVAVGGDGTISEAVNGFFDSGGPLAQDAVFGFVTSGTGGDFRKSFGIGSGAAAGIAHLKSAAVRPIDVGRISCLSDKGEPTVRYFVNIASFGLSGKIVSSVNRARIAKLFGGQFAFAFHSALGALTHRDQTVRIHAGDEFDRIARISTVAIANGQYFGGGMRVAPKAVPDDGMFDLVILGGAPRREMLANMKLLYTGEHVKLPNVEIASARRVVAAPVAKTGGRAVFIEADGENVGRLPATFEILPRALNLRC